MQKMVMMNPLVKFAANLGLTSPNLSRLWCFGYNVEQIACVLAGIPPSFLTSFVNAIKCLEALAQNHDIKARQKMMDDWQCIDPRNDQSDKVLEFMVNPGSHSSNAEGAFGCLVMMFDPETQLRRSVTANECFATINGSNVNHVLSLFDELDFPLPFTEMDFLVILLPNVLRESTVHCRSWVMYVRYASGLQSEKRCILVRRCSKSILNEEGRACEVRNNA
jgi:hypothetical protein